ncbi:MAG: hypothetical protein CSA11_12095 [Chloroflexi bacterium]|nr:MAG: hypothetical protein CSA11_12095 [Chloroflexota bacterium]
MIIWVGRVWRFVTKFLTAYEWVVLSLMLPLVLFSPSQWVLVLLVIPVLWLLRWAATGHLVPPTPLDGAVLGLLLMVLVSQYATYDTAHSLVKVVGMVYGVAVFYAVVQWVAQSRSRLWWGVAVLHGLVLGLTGLSLAVFGWMGTVPGLGGLLARIPERITSLASQSVNPNQVAGILLWLLPLAVLLTVTVLWRWRCLVSDYGVLKVGLLLLGLTGTSLVMLVVLALTRSRGALAGMAVTLVFMGLVGLLTKWRKAALVITVVVIGAAVIGVAVVGPEGMIKLLFAPTGVNSENPMGSIDSRLEIWSRAIYGLQDFPFTGMGMNNFRQVVHILYPLFLISPDTDIAHAHNHWLQAGLDLGIPGMIAYMALWLGLAFLLVWWWRHTDDSWLKVLALGFGGCLVAYFVYGLMDTIALGARPGFVFWGMLGLMVGGYLEVRRQQAE